MTNETTASMRGGLNEALPLGVTSEVMDDAAEVRRELLERMTRYVGWLLQHSPREGMRWTGTMTDLAEGAHLVWLTGRLLASDGRPMTFRELMERLCAVLHRPLPHNVHSLLCQARHRKGIRSMPFMDRAVELLRKAHVRNLLALDVL